MKKIPEKIINFAEFNGLTNISLNKFWNSPSFRYKNYLVYNATFKKNKSIKWFILANDKEIKIANNIEGNKLKEIYL